MGKAWLAAGIAAWALAGCSGEAIDDTFGANTGGAGAATSTASSGTTGGDDVGGAGVGGASATSSTGAGGSQEASDPAMDGPYDFAELDGSVQVPATGNTVAIHAAYPTDASGAPYPAVIFGHGFQLPPTQYYDYLRRLASFGYVAMTVDFQAGFFPNHVESTEELIYGLDWASAHPTLGPIVDVTKAGASGHSLGGKLALLAATMDTRIAAVITLDPVDGAMNCSAENCPDVSELMPVPIPTGFIGETTDASGGFQPCAPAADNFQTFYANTTAPSLSVEVLGANHMSFLDDLGSCGFTCSFCNAATAPQDQVLGLSRAYLAAFFERHLRGDTRYDDYLTGATAQARYVDTGQAVIESK